MFFSTSGQLCLLLQHVFHQGGCRAPLFSPHSILLCFPGCCEVTRIQANVPTSKRTPSTFSLPPCELPAQPSSRHRWDKTWGGMEQTDSQARGEATRNIQGTESTVKIGQLFCCRSIACLGRGQPSLPYLSPQD